MNFIAQNGPVVGRYGACAHVSRAELEIAEQEFSVMKKAGITAVRTDYDWNRLESSRGIWHFEHLDKLHDIAHKQGMEILPILASPPSWALPPEEHLEAWGEYVRQVVTRYGKDCSVWEVWNEENISRLWESRDRVAGYLKILQTSYRIIKEINPKLRVSFGGLAGVPRPFIEECLKAGAGNYFDIMAIHPYQSSRRPEGLIQDLVWLRQTLDACQLADKAIWITEIGWSTARNTNSLFQAFEAVWEYLGIPRGQHVLPYLYDFSLDMGGNAVQFGLNDGRYFSGLCPVGITAFADLDPKQYPVVFVSGNEALPYHWMPELKRYLNLGGTIVFTGGFPAYFDRRPTADGYTSVQVNGSLLNQLHLGWEAWWTKKGVPREEKWQRPAPVFEGKFTCEMKTPFFRFMNDSALQPGDEFIPVLLGGDDTYQGALMAIYKLNSDLKGNIVVCTNKSSGSNAIDEATLATYVPRALLLAMAAGVERIFWYNFSSRERDRGDYFGITRKDLSPMEAYQAYQTLACLCPPGSTHPILNLRQNCYDVSWTRPDGVLMHALWTSQLEQSITWSYPFQRLIRATDYLGRPIQVNPDELRLTGKVLYVE